MSETIEEAVKRASEKWQSSFNRRDSRGCSLCYEEYALMVASPLGSFKGRDAIQAFWQKLIEGGFTDVTYVDPKIEVIDDRTAILSADWTMNKAKGLITKELWIIQPDGTALLQEDYFEAHS